MKIVLFGKNGQLGSELDKQARKIKTPIASFAREEVDITEFETVIKIIKNEKPDVVINASAFHVVPECEAFPQKAFEINASALKHLAEISNEKKFTLIQISTDYVFDGKQGTPYKEDAKPNPLQTYGISKQAGDFFVLNYAHNGIVIRTCGVYGGVTGSKSKKGNFVLTILKQTEDKDELEVSSEQIVIPTYATDLAVAIIELLQKKDLNGIYHLVNEGYCSWADFATEIMKIKKRSTKIIPVNRGGMAGSLRRPLFSALENYRAKKLGIVLPLWQDALKRYLATL